MKEYERKTENFERAVTLLQENLQYLANKEVVSSKFINLQNSIIKSLIDYQQDSERRIGEIEFENIELQHLLSNHIDKYQQKILKLEATCIIHGVLDINSWLAKSFELLEDVAVESYKERSFTLPSFFLEEFESWNEQDKSVFRTVLERKNQEHIDREINNIKAEINGIRTQRNQETIRG